MSSERLKRIHIIYGIFLSIAIVAAAVCLMAACVGIYRSGEQPFSREAVALAFGIISVPVYLCLGLIVLGFLLDLAFGKDDQKQKTVLQYSMIHKKLLAKADLVGCNEQIRSAIVTQQKSRILHRTVTVGLLAAGSIVFLCYALKPGSFHPSQINDSMIRAMYVLLPCMAAPFAYGIFAAFHARASLRKEIALLKLAPKLAEQVQPRKESRMLLPRLVLLAVGVGILLFGLFTGGTADVLTKAINICTECVGLG